MMLLSLLTLSLTLQASPGEVDWMRLIEAGDREPLLEEIGRDPEGAGAAGTALLGRFDASIHSHRDKPEQRRVRYSDELLQSGLQFSQLLAEVIGDRTLQQRFEARRDRIHATKLLNDKEWDQALSLIESVRATARELEDRSFLLSTYLSSAYGYLGTGRPEQALADCQAAFEIAQELGNKRQYALAIFNLGTAHLHLGQLEQALNFSTQAAAAAAEIGVPIWEANAWLNVGYVEIMRRNFAASKEALHKTLALSQKAGDRLGEGRAYYNLGLAHFRLKEWRAAADNLENSLTFIREVDIRHSHEIDEYNYVEKDTLDRLLHSYRELQIEDPAILAPVQHRLEELAEMPAGGAHHHTH